MIITAIHADIIQELETGFYDYAAHGCNCMGMMGSGVAPILNRYTNGALLEMDRKTELGNINKMGSFTLVSHDTEEGSIVDICNFYTQFEPRTVNGSVVVHWESYKSCLMGLLELADIQAGDVDILMPMIGCGLAGGDVKDLLDATREVVQTYMEVTGVDTTYSSIVFVSNEIEMAQKMGYLIDTM